MSTKSTQPFNRTCENLLFAALLAVVIGSTAVSVAAGEIQSSSATPNCAVAKVLNGASAS